jgi:hypothetical protein
VDDDEQIRKCTRDMYLSDGMKGIGDLIFSIVGKCEAYCNEPSKTDIDDDLKRLVRIFGSVDGNFGKRSLLDTMDFSRFYRVRI